MPGAYAHLTLVNLFRERARLEGIPGFPVEAKRALRRWFKFCELGAVSPDYPYLALTGREGARQWADMMHYTRTGEMIHAGIRHLKTMTGDAREKGLAWLLGYAAHVTTDVTIHPVVERKVGPYKGNELEHRICEMHQNAYVFQRLNLEGIGLSNYFDTGIATCTDPLDRERFDADVVAIWHRMLRDVHPAEYAANVPDMNKWHHGFQVGIGKIASEGYHLCPLARHVAMGIGLSYPLKEEIDNQFIRSLETPLTPQDYDVIFDRAVSKVTEIWQIVAVGVVSADTTYIARIGVWDLDTGLDDNNRFVFWGQA